MTRNTEIDLSNIYQTNMYAEHNQVNKTTNNGT